MLTQNNLKELADLDPLGACAKLVFLSVAENPVARKEVCLLTLRGDCGLLCHGPYACTRTVTVRAGR